jgi:two-component system sensor histidine kinase RegB
MEGTEERQPDPAPQLEIVARLLRHEVGDLLQTVYAAVAILQERLPADWVRERRLLVDLRARAENCKNELDALHDLVGPLALSVAPFDLGDLAAAVISQAAGRQPALEFPLERPVALPVVADGQRLAQVGLLLLHCAAQSAHRQVRVRAAPAGPGEVEWSFWDDGLPAPPEVLAWLERPFATTHHAQAGLTLALADRVLRLHGGRVEASNPPEGGFRVRLFLPVEPTGEA